MGVCVTVEVPEELAERARLARNREGSLPEAERARLDDLMTTCRRGLVRKS